MSRSYKKHPIFTDNSDAGEKKSWKKIFNKKLRRSSKYIDIPDGGYYKKCNESYYICDFKSVPDWDDPDNVRKARMK